MQQYQPYTTHPKLQAILLEEALKRQLTGPIASLARAEAHTEEIAIEDMPTAAHAAVQPSTAIVPLGLPVDALGRPCLKVVNPFESTVALVEAAIVRFREAQGCYPSVILLSAFRYLTYGMMQEYYYCYPAGNHRIIRIPYSYDGSVDYDVLCRGEVAL